MEKPLSEMVKSSCGNFTAQVVEKRGILQYILGGTNYYLFLRKTKTNKVIVKKKIGSSLDLSWDFGEPFFENNKCYVNTTHSGFYYSRDFETVMYLTYLDHIGINVPD